QFTIPKAKAFLSDKNRAFDRQTRARRVDKFSAGGGDGMHLSDLAAFSKNFDPLKKAAREINQSHKNKTGSSKKVSSTNDHIEGVPLGDLTYLNTVEYKYYGFYHRIKQKL